MAVGHYIFSLVKFQNRMSRLFIAISCLLFFSCKNKNTFINQKSNQTFVYDIDSVFSDQIQMALRRIIFSDKGYQVEKKVYSAYIKKYFNTTTVFFRREYEVDSLHAKFADAFCLLDSNLFIVYNGMNDIKGAIRNLDIIKHVRQLGFRTEWDGIVRDNPGFMFYIYKGGIDKIDSSLSTDFNLINQEKSINFIKPQNYLDKDY